MKFSINLLTIWTDNFKVMKDFYSGVLGFIILEELENYVEFENEGVRFAICGRKVMEDLSIEYKKRADGQVFELAFECENTDKLDKEFDNLLDKGVEIVREPTAMPWGQKTAFFKDPDGNIHEIFSQI